MCNISQRPWSYISQGSKNARQRFIIDANGRIISHWPSEADATLMAAAPELLEALEYLVGAHEHPWATERGSRRGVLDHVPPALENAKAAIVKARGSAPAALPLLAGEGR